MLCYTAILYTYDKMYSVHMKTENIQHRQSGFWISLVDSKLQEICEVSKSFEKLVKPMRFDRPLRHRGILKTLPRLNVTKKRSLQIEGLDEKMPICPAVSTQN